MAEGEGRIRGVDEEDTNIGWADVFGSTVFGGKTRLRKHSRRWVWLRRGV